MKLIDKDALVAEITKIYDRKVLCDGCEEKCEYNKKQPSIPDIVDEHFDEILGYIPPDANIIQYASREEGIKANAEEYSYNIESELFQQLSKEQQKLWRKEIEQACISGGYYGLNIANDKRYDKEEPVSEELEEASKEWLIPQLDKSYANYGEAKMMELTHFDGYAMLDAIEFGAKWQKTKDESTTEDLGDYINKLSKQFPEVSFAKLSRIAVRVAKWQKEQFEKNRLKHCNSITNEQAELEQGFIDQHLDKHQRMPTFLDAIEYGMRLQKEQIEEALLSEVLPCFMHGGEADEVVAKLDEVLSQKKYNYE